MDGNVIIKVSITAIESLKDDALGFSYGVLENATEIICKASKAAMKSVKVLSSKVKEKKIFKANFDF